jgi:hypothetical protein
LSIFPYRCIHGNTNGGVELAILAIDQLFDFKFNSRIYTDTFLFLPSWEAALSFFLFNEKGLSNLEKENLSRCFKIFHSVHSDSFTAHLCSDTLFYSLRSDQLATSKRLGLYLILAQYSGHFSLASGSSPESRKYKIMGQEYFPAFYYTILPLIILLFTAIFTRILEYGFTEPRYFVCLLAVWLLVCGLFYPYKKGNH